MPSFGFGGSFIPALILPPMGADMGGLGKRRIQARKVTAYTPSFNALFYNIKGAKPSRNRNRIKNTSNNQRL